MCTLLGCCEKSNFPIHYNYKKMNHKVLFPNISVRFFSLCFFVIFVLFKTVVVESGILIDKRARPPSNLIKNYCVLSEKESDGDGDHSSESTSLKVSCSQIPGPLIKLDVGEDSYLKLKSNLFIAPGEYCALSGNPKYGRLCQSHSDPVWHKCCPENEILDASTFKCRRSRIKFRPKVGKSTTPQSFVIPKNNTEMRFNGAKLQCSSGFVSKVYSSNPCLPESSGIFQLAPNGTPMYEISMGVFLRKRQLKSIDHDTYCVDGILDFASSSCATFSDNGYHITGGNNEEDLNDKYSGGNCRDTEMGEVLLVCMEEQDTILNEDGDDDVPKAYFFAGIWLSTCPFLLTAAIVNSCVIQKNVHGWILTCYLVSMFLVNINSVVLILDIHIPVPSLGGGPTGTPIETGCGLLDFTMKFIYFSSLCWMSSMCMNMMQTFSSTVPQVVVEPHRFLISAIFSLGFPIIPVSISYYVGSLPDDKSLFEDFRKSDNSTISQVSQQQQLTCQRGSCALYSYKTLPYYSGPIIFLVLCNVVAFLKTSTTIASLRKQAEAVLHKQTRDHIESFALFAKLFLLTGSIWVIRVVLLVLQIQSLYVTWYGVALETVFSIPEVVFPMIIFHHPEFIKWAWNKSPMISRLIIKCSPFCKKDLLFKDQVNTPELQSVNQVSSVSHQNCTNHHISKSTSDSHNTHNDKAPCNPDITTATSNGVAGTETEMQSTTV